MRIGLTLWKHETGLKLAVAVAVLVAHLFTCCDEGGSQRRAVRPFLDSQEAVGAVVLAFSQVRVAVVFRFGKVWQDVVVGPARVAVGRPAVVIPPVTADV